MPRFSKSHSKSAKCSPQNSMCYTRGYASAKSQGVIINAVKHSLFAHSLISANEEGGTALPPALLCWKFVLEQFTCSTYSRALDQFSPYLSNNEREW